MWTNPSQKSRQGSDPPPFRQCLYFGTFWSSNPSLSPPVLSSPILRRGSHWKDSISGASTLFLNQSFLPVLPDSLLSSFLRASSLIFAVNFSKTHHRHIIWHISRFVYFVIIISDILHTMADVGWSWDSDWVPPVDPDEGILAMPNRDSAFFNER